MVRLRQPDCAWGPPRRTVVPDVYGQIEGPRAREAPAEESLEAKDEQATVVHVPALATAEPVSSGTGSTVAAGGLGVPLFLTPSTPGLRGITLEGETQTWMVEDGRALDIYF